MRDSNELFAHYVDSYFTRALCSPQSRHNHNIPNFVFHSTTCKYTLKIFRNFGCNGKMFTEHCRCRATVIALCELKSGVNGRKSQIRGDNKQNTALCLLQQFVSWMTRCTYRKHTVSSVLYDLHIELLTHAQFNKYLCTWVGLLKNICQLYNDK